MRPTLLAHLPILLPVGLLALVQLLLKWQAGRIALADGTRPAYLRAMAASPWVWLALGLAVAAFLAWLLVLRRLPLAYAYPFVALTFPLVAAGSGALLGERVSGPQAGALALLVAGVALHAHFAHRG